MKEKINFRGFTLIELLVVIVIMGVLATVSISTYGNFIKNAERGQRDSECATSVECEKSKDICRLGTDNPASCDNLCEMDKVKKVFVWLFLRIGEMQKEQQLLVVN